MAEEKKSINSRLINARKNKNDEFYTQYSDIASEMGHYRQHFKGKVVYCNCDDPTWSNFWRYFHNNFASLGLKKLISTHYQKDSEPSYSMEYTGGNDFDMDAGKINEIKGNLAVINDKEVYYTAGDFRSNDCIKLLKEADIVVTNPPFSLFREYIEQLVQYDKKFIIIGNKNAVGYKNVFPLIFNNSIWIGHRPMNSDMWLRVPEDAEYEKIVDGVKLKHIMGCWYTNLDIAKRHNGLWHVNGQMDKTQAHCYYEGHEERYPKYDNYDAINVDKVSMIPIDYAGIMGVPITYLDKYQPNEFELLGISSTLEEQGKNKEKKKIGLLVGGKAVYTRILIKNRNPIAKKDDK